MVKVQNLRQKLIKVCLSKAFRNGNTCKFNLRPHIFHQVLYLFYNIFWVARRSYKRVWKNSFSFLFFFGSHQYDIDDSMYTSLWKYACRTIIVAHLISIGKLNGDANWFTFWLQMADVCVSDGWLVLHLLSGLNNGNE